VTDSEQRGIRLKAFIKTMKIKQTVLAQRIGFTPGFISRVISGQEVFTGKLVLKLSESFPMLNMDWLLRGDGEMFLGDTEKKNTAESESPPGVREPDEGYVTDPVGQLRRLFENFEKRISALEAEVQEMKQSQPK